MTAAQSSAGSAKRQQRLLAEAGRISCSLHERIDRGLVDLSALLQSLQPLRLPATLAEPCRCRRQPFFEFALDLVQVLRLRLQRQRLIPLEAGFAFAADAP